MSRVLHGWILHCRCKGHRLIALNKLQGRLRWNQTDGTCRVHWPRATPVAAYSLGMTDLETGLRIMRQETGQFYKSMLNNSKKNLPIWEKSVSSQCLRSNVYISRPLTWQRVDYNVVSQQHTLLCRWQPFIMLMLFILLGGRVLKYWQRQTSVNAASSLSDFIGWIKFSNIKV